MAESLLIELLTEELPPKALSRLMQAFSRNIFEGLKEKNFLADGAEARPYATPRRLAVMITNVLDKQPDRLVERKGPAVATGLDDTGQPTPALLGFAKSCGVEAAKLEKRGGDKGEYFIFCSKQKGERLKQHLAAIVEAALKKLPTPKLMRWGDGDVQFVRPVHGVVLLHGKKIVPGVVLGLKSGNKTRGHRFLSRGAVSIPNAKDYEKILKQHKVSASFDARREAIARVLDANAKKVSPGANWSLGNTAELVNEVTGLVEYPVVLTGSFDKSFLDLPRECLIISMQQHQRYFPLVDKQGKLLPQFLFVSNMKAANPKEIIHGNERVLRARLSDARFFFEQDKKIKLTDRVPKLANVVYHNKLGNQLERVLRIQKLAIEIAGMVGAERKTVELAAYLCKADLLTEMVGEFPELQGIMGQYYAKNDDSKYANAAVAIREHYLPRYAGDTLPLNAESISVALADKLDTLVGIYGIGLVPTGEKDPFGLRRQALGVIRILMESKNIPSLDILALLQSARSRFPSGVVTDNVAQDLHTFMLERLRPYLKEKGFESHIVDAVINQNSKYFDKLPNLLAHVQAYFSRPEAKDLAEINKRVLNIIKKNREEIGWDFGSTPVELALLKEQAEINLYTAMESVTPVLDLAFEKEEYGTYFDTLVTLKPVLSNFFDKEAGVLVMHPDQAIRVNRAKILQKIGRLMNRVADISRMQT